METLVSKLQETRQQVSTQRDALVTRARDASESFVTETRGASRDLAGFMGREAKRWRRFLVQRASVLKDEVRGSLSIPAIERRVLVRVDRSLRSLDARVRDRIAELSGKPTRKRTKRTRKATRTRPQRLAS